MFARLAWTTFDSNDQNQVAYQRFSSKQWFAGVLSLAGTENLVVVIVILINSCLPSWSAMHDVCVACTKKCAVAMGANVLKSASKNFPFGTRISRTATRL